MIFSRGNSQELCTFVPKCAKNHAFSTCFELMTQCLTTNEYDPSLNCAVGSIARQVEQFSILGKDKRDPNETLFCSLDVSLRSPLQSSPIK